MTTDKHIVRVANKDGSIDIYEADGVNAPTKNGKPIYLLPIQSTKSPYNLPDSVMYSKPFKKSK